MDNNVTVSTSPSTNMGAIEKEKENDTMDTLLNTDDYLFIGKKLTDLKVVPTDSAGSFSEYSILTYYHEDAIIGKNFDEADPKSHQLRAYKKYNPKTSFEDFPIKNIYDGPLADPDFSTNPDARWYVTKIKNGCKEQGVNFAGHYTLLIWDCGQPCQTIAIIDRKDGRIHFGDMVTAYACEFQKNSNLFIRNAGLIEDGSNLIRILNYATVTHDVWTGEKFEEVEIP